MVGHCQYVNFLARHGIDDGIGEALDDQAPLAVAPQGAQLRMPDHQVHGVLERRQEGLREITAAAIPVEGSCVAEVLQGLGCSTYFI